MLLDYFVRGGVVMWPILAASVVALGVVLDRFVWFARGRGDPNALRREALRLMEAGSTDQALAACAASPHPVAAVLEAGLSAWGEPQEELERRLEQAAADQLEQAEVRLPLLATMIAVLPMLGFLGTITGLINAFEAWSNGGAQVTIELLAAGLSEAMITTAAGLVTSIPYVVAYNALTSRVALLARALNAAASEVAGRHRIRAVREPLRLAVVAPGGTP